ncbi:hypothetical protein EAF04_002166 [Stromatinia cepivora]|nr:hypothetical protein EAF04_002166 [Stromatinia cepivora]
MLSGRCFRNLSLQKTISHPTSSLRSTKHRDYQMPDIFEFKNRIHASYHARAPHRNHYMTAKLHTPCPSINYEKQQYEQQQSISSKALRRIGPCSHFLVENNTPDCFEPRRCFRVSFAEIFVHLGADASKICMAISKLWNQALCGFVAERMELMMERSMSASMLRRDGDGFLMSE